MQKYVLFSAFLVFSPMEFSLGYDKKRKKCGKYFLVQA